MPIHVTTGISLKTRMLKEISGKDKYRETVSGFGIARGRSRNRERLQMSMKDLVGGGGNVPELNCGHDCTTL